MRITINGTQYEEDTKCTILACAKRHGISIPTLCYLKDANEISACRICVVQLGDGRLVPACSTACSDGMVVETENDRVREARRMALELLCSNHTMNCTECPRGADCRLRSLCMLYNADDRAFGIGSRKQKVDDSTPYLVRDNSKCVLCRRCVSVCGKFQKISAIGVNNRGNQTNVGFPPGMTLAQTGCVGCGQCLSHCPTGALSVHDDTKRVWKAIYKKDCFVVAAVSPDTAKQIGLLFGEKELTDNSGKIAALLRKFGFDMVIDSACFAGQYETALLQEASRWKKTGTGPAFSPRCTAARTWVEKHAPQYLSNMLPMQSMRVELAKYCKEQLDKQNVFYVSIDNCIAAKAERLRPECSAVDAALTTRELFTIIQRACVSSFTALEVWKNAVPETYDILPGKQLTALTGGRRADFEIKRLQVQNQTFRAVFCSGLGQTDRIPEVFEKVDMVDIAACPGGCPNGGGSICTPDE